MKKIDISTKSFPDTFALVDDADFEWLSQWRWSNKKGYARRNTWEPGTKRQQTIWMHRLINNTPMGYETDHIDRNPLNNQRENLRTVTGGQNKMNIGVRSNSTSKITGVNWDKKKGKWMARIGRKFLGYFTNKEDARACRELAVQGYWEGSK